MSLIFLFIFIGLLWHIQGESLAISSKFKDGDVIFTWTNVSSSYHVFNRNTTGKKWVQGYYKTTQSAEYTVRNVLLYDSIYINIIVTGKDEQEFNITYEVYKVQSQIGKAVNISWTASYFPVAGIYRVYQSRKKEAIFQIRSNDISFGENISPTKYKYNTSPYYLTNISFEIKNITMADAGYYYGGEQFTGAGSGGGVVLIVKGKPSKPDITEDLNVEENEYADLTCSSQSTSAPDYYSKHVTLSYNWFVNDTKIHVDRETTETLRLYVAKDIRYNRYSCTATEEDMESDRSATVQINPLYGPDEIRFEPNLDIQKEQLITIREGETIGPCIADCNPPCNMTWKYMDANGTFYFLPQGKNMSKQHVNRYIKSYHCVAEWKSQSKKERYFALDVKYMDKPVLFKNNNNNSEPMWTLNDSMPLRIACFVDGNPIPTSRLFKGNKELAKNTNTSKWTNHTATRCEDTNNYICEGSSNWFNSSNQTVIINITCNLRIDESGPLQTIFSSTSGENIKVVLAIPVIANPPPQTSDITWMGPTDHPIKSTVSQREVVYKHWINTSVPIHNHSNFGYYVMKYRNETIHNITIKAQDRPQQPLNFMAHAYASGYVNMTWTSGFNGGSEQFFLIWMSDGTGWKIIANLTDPGKGGTAHFNHGPLTPGQEIVYSLESCNIINCSVQSVDMKVNVKDIQKASLIEKSEVFYAVIGVSTGILILIVILVVVFVIFFRSKNEKKSIADNEITQEETNMYAVVDKSKTSNNRGKDKAGTSSATKDNYGSIRNSTGEMYAAGDKSLLKENNMEATALMNDNTNEKEDASQLGAETYAVVDKSILKKGGVSKTTNKLLKTKKNKDKNKGKNGSLEEETVSPVSSRKTNDEGLIYIDVEFTNKPESSDTNQTHIIHGEEDRTEYTFVDFSRKAPPTPETRDKEGK